MSADSKGNEAICVRGIEALAIAALQELSAETRALGECQRNLAARLVELERQSAS